MECAVSDGCLLFAVALLWSLQQLVIEHSCFLKLPSEVAACTEFKSGLCSVQETIITGAETT